MAPPFQKTVPFEQPSSRRCVITFTDSTTNARLGSESSDDQQGIYRFPRIGDHVFLVPGQFELQQARIYEVVGIQDPIEHRGHYSVTVKVTAIK